MTLPTHILRSRGMRESTPNRPVIVSGKGAWITDSAGQRYLDAACGSGSLIFGHGDLALSNIVADQGAHLTIFPSGAFRVEIAERYAAALAEFAPAGFSQSIIASSGSDAVEAALKACLQYHSQMGAASRTVFIGRDASYHGNTLAGLAAGGFVSRRAPYARSLPEWPKAEVAREGGDLASMLESVERAIKDAGPTTVAGVIIEPIVGAALSAAVPPSGYVEGLRTICDAYGLLLIADEVMTGFGRTGSAFACSRWAISPDIIIAGKAISAGYYPLSAILIRDAVADQLTGAGGYFENGQTHCWNPVAAAIGLEVTRRLADGQLMANCQTMGDYLRGQITAHVSPDIVGNVRGEGLMIGFDIMHDAPARAERDTGVAQRFHRAALNHGLLFYPSHGGPGTTQGDHALLLPPLTLTAAEADWIVACLAHAAQDVMA